MLLAFSTVSCKKKGEQESSGVSFIYNGFFKSTPINLYNGTDSLTIIGDDDVVQLLVTIPQSAAVNTSYSIPAEASLSYSNGSGPILYATSGTVTITQRDDQAFTGTFAATLAGNGSTVSLTDGRFRLNFKE
jgi:hypothetical protein